MFNYKNILLISKQNLSVSRVNNKKIKTTSSFVYSNDTLTQQIGAIKNKYGSSYRILLDDCFVYTAHIYLVPGENLRLQVQEKAQEIIPEDLSQTMWDFKQESELRDDNQKDGRYYQILAVNKQFYTVLKNTITTLGLNIEAIEPISQALARSLAKKHNQPFFILYRQNQPVLVTCFGEIVIDVKTLEQGFGVEGLKQYQAFVEQKYGLKPDTIFIPNQENLGEDFEQVGLNLSRYHYQPEFSLQQKADLHGEDLSILNLDPQNSDNKRGKSFKLIVAKPVLIISILLLIIIGGWFFGFKQKKPFSKNTSFKQTSQSATATPKPKITTNSYSITILNGNGVEGAAGEAETLLDNKGYKVVNLDNADNYDYEQTILQHKQTINQNFLNQLDKLLKTKYDVIIDEQFLDETGTADVVIILGQQ